MRLFFTSIFFTTSFCFAQAQTASDIFHGDVEIVYRGVDYSQTKMVDAYGFNDPVKIKSHYFDAWNKLLWVERFKYDLAGAMRIDKFRSEFSLMSQHNQKADENAFVVNTYQPTWTKVDLQEIVDQNVVSRIEAQISMAWIVEALDKKNELATFHLVFFNSKTMEIIFNEKFTGQPKGFGFRNYWVNPFEGAIREIKKKKYKMWRKSYN